MLNAEAGRYPNGDALREPVSELHAVSKEFRTRWAAHKTDSVERTHQPLDLPVPSVRRTPWSSSPPTRRPRRGAVQAPRRTAPCERLRAGLEGASVSAAHVRLRRLRRGR
ncbi:MAG: hypothetical protein HOZ81_15095 [Streptomyces sp.]|nr:hypothetical protein [Streptomyces sp.]NUT29906.1 hypothetical protein [Streptomyces sp.]